MPHRVDAQVAHPGGQAQRVRALGQQRGLQQGVQEGDPVAGPVQGATLAAVARPVNALNGENLEFV